MLLFFFSKSRKIQFWSCVYIKVSRIDPLHFFFLWGLTALPDPSWVLKAGGFILGFAVHRLGYLLHLNANTLPAEVIP